MKSIRVNRAEFEKFRELQNPKKRRKDCHAAFSTNPSEDAWCFVTLGLTPKQLREEVRHHSSILDQVFGVFIELRPIGGRFFIDDDGAYWKDEGKIPHRFVEWIPEEPFRTTVKQPTYSELKAMTAVNRAKNRR